MKILLIIDPLKNLYPKFDSSLYLLKEFWARGHETWTADTPDISNTTGRTWIRASRTAPRYFRPGDDVTQKGHVYQFDPPVSQPADSFQIILYRKEPPFDMNYLIGAKLLENLPKTTFVSNHPAAIRETCGEKIGCLRFSKWMPQTLVSSRQDEIIKFRSHLKNDLVLKPLDLKGGIGVRKISKNIRSIEGLLHRLTHKGTQPLMAQEFVPCKGRQRDKRFTLLDGKLFWSFEKKAALGNFRTNLDQGGTVSKTTITKSEKQLIQDVASETGQKGLHLVGLDVIQGKLIDYNVTCAGGFSYAIKLFPNANLIGQWADFLERDLSSGSRLKP